MAINTFGITSANVAALCGYLAISATTEPNTTDVTEWIAQYAAEAINVLRSVGIDGNAMTATTDETLYSLISGKLARRVAADVHISALELDTTLAERYINDWDRTMGRIRSTTGAVVGNTSTGITTRSHTKTATDKSTRPSSFWTKNMLLLLL